VPAHNFISSFKGALTQLLKPSDTPHKMNEEDLSYATSASSAILYQSPKGGQKLLWAIMAFIVNQPLVRLDDKRFSSDLDASESRQEQLIVKSARLLAESEGKIFSKDQLPAGISPKIVEIETALYTKREEELNNKKQIIEEQIVQKQQELSASKSKARRLGRSYKILNKELELTEPLVAKGAASEVEVLRLKRKVNDVKGEMSTAQFAIPRLEASIKEFKLKLESIDSAFRSEAQADFNKVQANLNPLQKSTQAIADQVDRTLVRSPVAGTIKQLFVKTLGGVIQPGNDIVVIVPTEDKLHVEARVSPADIAFLHPEQKAMVKLTAYDFSIHGGLEGKVINISPDTITDRKGNSFYVVQVETEKAYLGNKDNPLPIIAGMTVTVDILTGKKTILDYILKPILKTKQLALRER